MKKIFDMKRICVIIIKKKAKVVQTFILFKTELTVFIFKVSFPRNFSCVFNIFIYEKR